MTHYIEIRVPSNLKDIIKKGVVSTGFRESVVFALASHAHLKNKTLLLVRKIIILPDHSYIPTSVHGAKWHGSAMLPILNEAMEKNLGVVMFHNHPQPGFVRLSEDDRRSAINLLPVFQNLIPFRPHASIVIGKDHAAGLVLMPDRNDYIEAVKIRWLGKIIMDCPDKDLNPVLKGDKNIYHRQMLLIGSKGQWNLQQAKVAVVGLTGGGSHIVQQLAHIGIGNIIGIDGDRADKTNRSRMIGLTYLDVLLKRKKISIMARVARKINHRVRFTAVPYPVPEQAAIDALKEVDVIIGCVDNLHARADIQDIAWRYHIPYVDIGLIIQPVNDGVSAIVAGNVATLIPGEYCLWCTEFLTEEKLLRETGGRPKSYFQGSSEQAQVISFNGVLASQAVNEVLQLLTGFAPTDGEMSMKKFNGLEGTLEKWVVKGKSICSKCQSILGAGDIIWRAA